MPDLDGRHILVVEDEALLALLVEDTLLDAGAAKVEWASTVSAALAILRRGALLDAAVLDVNLAGETSEAIALALAKLSIPYVYATGYGRGPMPTDNAPVLTKPYEPAALVLALAALCA